MIRVTSRRSITDTIIDMRDVEWGVDCTARKLAPPWADPDSPLVRCSRNGALVEDWDAQLQDGDHLHYWTRPGIAAALGITNAFLAFVVNLAASIAAGYLIRLLLPGRKPAQPGDQESSTAGFNPLSQNLRSEGAAIPVVYGRHRCAPPVINQYVRVGIDQDGRPTSEIVLLMALSEGPVNAVAGRIVDGQDTTLQTIELNEQPATSYEGVEAHVRLGDFDQEPITEFANPVQQYAVDQTLRDPVVLTHATTTGDTPGAGTAIATTGSFGAGDANITKWTANGETSMVSHIAATEAEEFASIVLFPQGLSDASGGSPTFNSFIYQLRYRKVDGGGTPFGNYIVKPAVLVRLNRTGPIRIESRHRVFDPDESYTPPAPGYYARSRATGVGNRGLSHTTSGFSPESPSALQFSFATWMRRRNVQTVSVSVPNRIFQWQDSGNSEGFTLDIYHFISTQAALRLRVGNGSTFTNVQTSTGSAVASPMGDLATDTTDFHHLAVTYEASYDGTSNSRVRFYLDGSLRETIITAAQAVMDETQQIRLMSDSVSSPTLGLDGHFDETTFWSKTLTPYEVAQLYNGGSPGPVHEDADGLIVGARMDDQVGSSPNINTSSFGPFEGTGGWLLGSGQDSSPNDPNISNQATADFGLVLTEEAGTPVDPAGRVLIEMLRLNTEDENFATPDEAQWASAELVTFEQFSYPGVALLAVKAPSTDQLSGGAPLVTCVVQGRLVPVWDGASADFPNFVQTYSRNPAWIAVDIATNKDFGLGAAFELQDIDVTQFQAFADYCDELVWDNEPRVPLTNAVSLGDIGGGTFRVVYRFATKPTNFPPISAVPTGTYVLVNLDSPSPAAPSWLTTEVASGPAPVMLVQYANGLYEIWVDPNTNPAGSSTYTPTSGVELEVHDVRFRYDGVFDRTDLNAWDAIVQVLQTARAAPIRYGKRLSVFYDAPGSPVAMIGMGNVVAGTWKISYEDPNERPNAESAEYLDEAQNWKKSSVSDELPDLTDPALPSAFRWRRMRIEGITRRGQVKRNLRRDLSAFNLVRRLVEFELGVDGVPVMPGDLLAISHDVAGYGVSGRLWQNSGNQTSFVIDRQVVLAAATTYFVQIESAAGDVRETLQITSGAATYDPGDSLTVSGSFSFEPAKDDKWAIGSTANPDSKLFRAVDVRLDPEKMRTRIRALEYDPQVYNDDFGELPDSASSLPVPTAPQIPTGVENLVVSEETSTGPDGSARVALVIEFQHIPETYQSVAESRVFLSESGRMEEAELVATLPPRSTSVRISGRDFARHSSYTVFVVPVARGSASAYRAFASSATVTVKGLAATPPALTSFSADIAGNMVAFEWEGPDNGTVEVRRGGWLLGQKVFVAPTSMKRWGPIPNWSGSEVNAEGAQTPDLVARVRIGTGQYGPPFFFTFEPDAPVSSGKPTALVASEEDGSWS